MLAHCKWLAQVPRTGAENRPRQDACPILFRPYFYTKQGMPRMHRALSYLLPIVIGLLLAIVLLNAFPVLVGRDAAVRDTASETAPRTASDTAPDAGAPRVELPAQQAADKLAAEEAARPAPKLRQAPLIDREQGPVSYAEAVEKAAPAVVNVYSSRVIEREAHPLLSDPFFEQFYGDDPPSRQRMLSSLGSGVIV